MHDEDDEEDKAELNKALARLIEENANSRRLVEAAYVIIRRRAPNAHGLTLQGSLTTILNDRDEFADVVVEQREELKQVLRLLSEGKFKDAHERINLYLFNLSG